MDDDRYSEIRRSRPAPRVTAQALRQEAMIIVRRTAFLSIIALGIIALWLARPAGANTVSEGDSAAIQGVITQQIQAFLADDADAAYAFAAPALRERFRTPAAFMRMVRHGYGPIYRAQSLQYGAVAPTDNGVTQIVRLRGPEGRSWVAYYSLAQETDEAWVITGVFLRADRQLAI